MNQPRKTPKWVKVIFRLMASTAGAAIGLSLVLTFADPPGMPLFISSIGGSAVFLFAISATPAAQPRALFGGHVGSVLIGTFCYQMFGEALWVYVLALVLTLIYMLVTKTVHPPAGANPLIIMHAHASLSAILHPVLLGITILAAVAAVWSRLVPGMIAYPSRWLEESPPTIAWGGWTE
jgi:CBS-domain-containing membrane protein